MSETARTLSTLFEKNRRFAESIDTYDTDRHEPTLVSVSCCDARVPQGELFGDAHGEHFTVANIGNDVVTHDDTGEAIVAGSVVYPIEKTDPEAVVIIGHTDCGAVTAAYDQVTGNAGDEERELQNELDLLVPNIERGLEAFDPSEYDRDETITRLVEYNVDRQVDRLVEHTDAVPVLGVVCDLHGYYSGPLARVHLVNYAGRRNRDAIPAPLEPNFHRKLEY